MPGAAARGSNVTSIERLSDASEAGDARCLDGPNDRQHIGDTLIAAARFATCGIQGGDQQTTIRSKAWVNLSGRAFKMKIMSRCL
jgi:hypothetical protein